MNAEEARQVDATLRRLGIPGVVAPEDPEQAAGTWRVYDSADPATRKDVTADVLAAFVAKFREANPEPPGKSQSGPVRGFIIPSDED
ncbi:MULTISPECIES: hypothetical protein [unclassified Streptomyces]|uniref:hypothetical protein n=1 Tax=unclassified Streptomyces TaxID=2593676 RepID=UPI000382E1CA|nr:MULTISPECIES: hypothetical protein [unclassified Streptomyces]MYT29314.1 hypothetical protein [Streptomyces sp. SID8354]